MTKETPREKALSICQEVALTTMFAGDCNSGYTLPLRIAKIIAKIVVKECQGEVHNNPERVQHWLDVDKEINLI